jgi:tetratricopeptide (TPR) repeat protein
VKLAQKLTAFFLSWGCCSYCAAADQYWGYQYKQINVTAQGSSDFARNLAHNLYRLELAMAAILQSDATWRPPIELYAVPAELFTALSGLQSDNGSQSKTTPYSSTLLINTTQSGELRYWSTYFSFGSSMFVTKYSSRYPSWFISGMSEVMAASSVEYGKVIIGGANPGRAYSLTHSSWIPLQLLLSVRGNDPQMSSRAFQDMYFAETWYLVHKILVDQFYRANFYQYFVRLDRGEDESKAFAESFDISYDDLSSALKKSITADKFMHYNVKIAGDDDGSKPVRLSQAEALGRLATYAGEHGVQPERAMELSAASLKLDPSNEDAKIGRIRAELRAANRDAAVHDADEICDVRTLSSKVAATCAFAFASVARNESDKSSQAEQRAKALKFYEQTVRLEPGDLKSWYGMSGLVFDMHDVPYAKGFIPRFTAVRAEHANIGGLAGSLASLYSMVGDNDTAMKYALAWQKHSISSQDKENATASIARLKSADERKQAAGDISAPDAHPKPSP